LLWPLAARAAGPPPPDAGDGFSECASAKRYALPWQLFLKGSVKRVRRCANVTIEYRWRRAKMIGWRRWRPIWVQRQVRVICRTSTLRDALAAKAGPLRSDRVAKRRRPVQLVSSRAEPAGVTSRGHKSPQNGEMRRKAGGIAARAASRCTGHGVPGPTRAIPQFGPEDHSESDVAAARHAGA